MQLLEKLDDFLLDNMFIIILSASFFFVLFGFTFLYIQTKENQKLIEVCAEKQMSITPNYIDSYIACRNALELK